MKKLWKTMGCILVSGIIGMIFWILLYQGNDFVGLCGAFMMLLTIFAYQKSEDNLQLKGIVICGLLCCILIITAQYISLGIEIHQVLASQGIDMMQALQRVLEFLSFTEVFQTTMIQLMIGYGGVLVVGSICYLFKVRKV